jgi:hypothetical protein
LENVIDLKVTHNLQDLADQVPVWQRDQLPFAMALTLTKLAKTAQKEIVETMPQVFDRPTRYTLNSTYVSFATPKRLVALVKLKDFAGGRQTAQNNYLSPQVRSGERAVKRYERLLQSVGFMPKDHYSVPGSAAPLDSYGNISSSIISKIIKELTKAKTKVKKPSKTVGQRSSSMGEYFVLLEPRGKLLPGVYQRFTFGVGSAVKPILIYVRKTRYSKRLPFYEIAADVQRRDSQREFDSALSFALRTKKR